jgi:hypothetical protein
LQLSLFFLNAGSQTLRGRDLGGNDLNAHAAKFMVLGADEDDTALHALAAAWVSVRRPIMWVLHSSSPDI